MKNIALILLLFVLQESVLAGPPIQNFKKRQEWIKLNRRLKAIPSKLDNLSESVIVEKCSQSEEALIRNRLLLADDGARRVLQEIDETLENREEFKRKKVLLKVLNARNKLICAIEELSKSKYICGKDKENTYNAGFTLPFRGSKIKLFSIREGGPVELEQTLLHEAVHHCKTTDAAYFTYEYYNPPPHDTLLSTWDNIADTYAYWLRYGFCVPEENC